MVLIGEINDCDGGAGGPNISDILDWFAVKRARMTHEGKETDSPHQSFLIYCCCLIPARELSNRTLSLLVRRNPIFEGQMNAGNRSKI